MAAEAEVVTAQLQHAKERCCLLIQINSTAQSLLACGVGEVCHTREGLSQITEDLEHIFNHGLRDQQGALDNKCDFRVFLNNLTLSCPESSPPKFSPDDNSAESISETHGHDWLQQALLDQSLSLLIIKLANHRQLLEQLYLEHAFLRSDPHIEALCTCLQAIEKDEPDLLCQVDRILLNKSKYIDQWLKDSGEFACNMPDTLDSVPALSNSPSGIEIVYSDSNNSEKDEFQTASSHSSPSDNHIEISDCAVDFADGFQPYLSQTGQNFSYMPKGTQAYNTVTNGINVREQTVKTGIHRTAGEKRTALPLRKKIGLKATLAHAALSAVVESDEMASSPAKWFDGKDNRDRFHKLRRTNSLNDNLLCAYSGLETAENERLKSSTITNVGFESPKNMLTASFTGVQLAGESEGKRTDISFHEQKKAFGHNRSKSDQLSMVKLNQQNIDVTVQEENDKTPHNKSFGGVSRLSSSSTTGTESLYYNDPFLEDPYKEESLATILASQDLSSCELDKENAHFSISEALIAAIEQMKCDGIDSSEDEEDEEEDEEILHLKEALEKKRQEKKRGRHLLEQGAFSDGTTQSTTSDPSGESVFESEDELGHDWEQIKKTDEQLQECDNNFSISTPTPISESDSSSTEVAVSSPMSAETVAKSLLQKFANRKHPAASELQWLVSFKDAPQSLLPLPQTVAVAPDDAVEDESMKRMPVSRQNSLPCRMRGNLEWAPPRPQIIFHAHNPPRRKVLMMFQNYRCAGCGMAVAPDYMKRFRYCHYLGKYFCSSCHNNFLEVIPARVVRKWDFKKYEVSNFARDLLNRIHYEPFFNIMDLNGALLKRVRVLQDLKDIRRQLHYFETFIQTCRKGQELAEEFSKLPDHICREPCLYSMHDLLQTRDGSLVLFLKTLVKSSLNHISQCQLCLAKGFICEYCKNGDDVIFPFELNRVVQCAACRASFHKVCFVEGKCPKCERIRIRKQMINEPVTPDDNPD